MVLTCKNLFLVTSFFLSNHKMILKMYYSFHGSSERDATFKNLKSSSCDCLHHVKPGANSKLKDNFTGVNVIFIVTITSP